MDTVLVERVWEGFGDGEAGWESECRRVSVQKSGGGYAQRVGLRKDLTLSRRGKRRTIIIIISSPARITLFRPAPT